MKKILYILAFIAISLTSCERTDYLGSPQKGGGSEEEEQSVVMWKEGDMVEGVVYPSFRIPTLARSPFKIFAFCEARTTDTDTGDIDIICKISEDNGLTWSDSRILVNDNGNTCGNPCAVFLKNGRLLMLFNWQYTKDEVLPSKLGVTEAQKATHERRVFSMYSDDEGASWSKPVDITDMVMEPDWTWNAMGPCHAIQLAGKDHKGRIVFPCDMKFNKGTARTDLCSYSIFSDDGGNTWTKSNLLGYGNESCATERSDGKLHLDMRNANSAYYEDGHSCRAYSYSTDGGETWDSYNYDYLRPEPTPVSGGTKGCQGSMINYNLDGIPTNKMIFSNPADDITRSKLTLRFSTNNGVSWQSSMLINRGLSGYSDLVIMDDGSVGVLYENGRGAYDEQISLRIVSALEVASHF